MRSSLPKQMSQKRKFQVPRNLPKKYWIITNGWPLSCSQCQNTVSGFIQCESCNLHYYPKFCGISEEALSIIGDIESLHWFCQPCKVEVFKVVSSTSSGATQEAIISTVAEQFKNVIQETKECLKKTIEETIQLPSKQNVSTKATNNMETDCYSTSNPNNSSTTSAIWSGPCKVGCHICLLK